RPRRDGARRCLVGDLGHHRRARRRGRLAGPHRHRRPRPGGGAEGGDMRVLVTGGLGFLGTSVVSRLRTAGHAVIAADVRPGADALVDVTDAAAVDAAFTEHRPEVVVHLASIVTPGRDSDRAREHAVDVEGSRHVLEACLAHGVRRLVVSSSGAAYGYHPDNGAAHDGWLHEDDPLRGNVEFAYSDHKRIVEQMLAAARETHPELEQVVLRIGTIL